MRARSCSDRSDRSDESDTLMSPQEFLDQLRQSREYRGQLVHIERIPARDARHADLAADLHPRLSESLAGMGIGRLYLHQAQAVNKSLAGAHTTIVTSTASGKTLCYNLPVLHKLLGDRSKRALYLFPTKALAQDQLRKLRDFGLDGIRFGIYDGDTPQAERRAIRRNSHIVSTNPDMLHLGIMPYHTNWADFFHNLAYVVIDEMHTYRGVFGANVSNVMRRLRRICRHYGCAPQFISCSATIANPGELMTLLTGVKAEIIDDDGSPSGEKWFAFWNPPYIGEGERKSANFEAAWLFAEMVRHGIRNITFAKARVVAELIYRYAKVQLEQASLADKIMSYRGGYTPAQRREIEQGLFDGRLIGVTATNALELGVDVGDLEGCVITGYPGTVASTWQQAGRAGRGVRSSLAVLIGLDNPLDQFLMRHPEYFFGKTSERAVVDPFNPYVAVEHLQCAAYELPITEWDRNLFGDGMDETLDVLREARCVTHLDKWYWIGDGYPAAKVNIRSTGGQAYQVYDSADKSRPLGSVEEASAFQVLHEGAVYLHQGESYVVSKLDRDDRSAVVIPREVDHYTTPRSTTVTAVKKSHSERRQGASRLTYGEIVVTDHVTGYRKKRLLTGEVLEVWDLDLPPQSFHTEAVWFVLDDAVIEAVRSQGLDPEGGIHGLEHALIGLMPLYSMCDRQDIGGSSCPIHPDTGGATIFIYDAHAGGVGISEAAFDRSGELLESTLRVLQECPCEEGCPSCIQSSKCGSNNTPLDKKAAILLLGHLHA